MAFKRTQKDLASGSTKMAMDMAWMRTTGSMFLHEFMHTRIADGGVEPHITDEYVDPIPAGEIPGAKDKKAKVENGGGVTRASTNADSYSLLANAIWWWDTTGYFPGVVGKENPSTAQDNAGDDDSTVMLYVDLGNSVSPAAADFNSLYNADLAAFGNGEPDPNDQDGTSTTAAPLPASSTSPPPQPSPSPPPPPPPPPSLPPPATDLCGNWYKVVLDHFEVRGSNFDPAKFGTDGSGLKTQVAGCGGLTSWSFQYTPQDPRFSWFASGNLAIGTKACLGRAVVSAGGASADGCTGAG